ncbi:MAG: tryptophan-rich sensory protein [candidate division KSB1 bacterium]|nr:tryptophan-rich sensory protein [candidate division KSB1 bacterium]MDZ7366438.1 tryptophan-rich sensory protein [candidate division KSB1 bacterium]MDZ7404600.1 tryptophan-rich sensory protein [candidate division KSB1 bacterium]
MKLTSRDWLALTILLALTFTAAFIGGLFTSVSVDGWYQIIDKPAWTPPRWVFGPVWTLLYLGMAVAAWLVWRQRGQTNVTPALTLFFVQLVLNTAWSVFFFGFQNPAAAFVDIVLLWSAILATMIIFWRLNPVSGWLFTPYILWVTFAATLNFAIWRMNV